MGRLGKSAYLWRFSLKGLSGVCPLDFIFRLYNFHQVISSAPTFFFRTFSLLKSNPKVWEHSLVEKLTNKENRTTDQIDR